MSVEEEIRAHRLAAEIARRVSHGKAAGTPSVYNVAREVLAEEFDDEASEALR